MVQDDSNDVKRDEGEDADANADTNVDSDALPPALFARERAHLPYHLAYEALDLLSDSTQKV